jgi:hypothetical protein
MGWLADARNAFRILSRIASNIAELPKLMDR